MDRRWFVDGGRGLICGGGVGMRGGGLVRFGFIFWVNRGTLVLDISNITVVVISGIGHSLDASVGQEHLSREKPEVPLNRK